MKLISDSFRQYLNYIIRQGILSTNTVESYRNDLLKFIYWLKGYGIFHLQQIDKEIILKYLDSLKAHGSSSSTLVRFISSLKQFYEYLFKHHLITVDPTVSLKSAQFKNPRPLILSSSEVNHLLSIPNVDQSLGLRDRAELEMMYASGLRASEIINLRVYNLKLNYRLIQISGRSSRVVPMDQEAAKWVQTYRLKSRPKLLKNQVNDYLFLNRNGNKMTRQGLWQNMKRYVNAAGIDKKVTLGTLRNTFAFKLLSNGADQRIVKKLLGYSSLSTIRLLINDYSIENQR